MTGSGHYTRRGYFDGYKWLCADDFEAVVFSRSENASANCIVYSFGLAREVSFELAMIDAGKS